MPNHPSIYHSDDVFRLFTSREWMNRRHTSPSNFYPYIEDLQHLASAYETGAVDDLPKRIALSYLEHRVRYVYAEVPKSMLEALWLSHEDVNSRILPLALSMPRLRQRIEYLHHLADLLIIDRKFTEALGVIDIALALYSTTDEADYCDEHVRRGMGHSLAWTNADLGRVDYDLLDCLYKQHQWLDASINDSKQWDPDSVGSRFTRDVLQEVLKRLGKIGAIQQATDLIRHSGGKWLSGFRWYSAQHLTQHLTAGLIRGKHFADAEHNLLDLGFDQQDVVRLWCDYLDELYDANEEARFSAVRPKIGHTPVWAAITERSQLRRPGLTTGQFPPLLSDGILDRAEIKNWLATQFTANLWQHEFSHACDYLDFWPTLENRALTHWSLFFEQIKKWSRRQSLSSRSGARDISFGSFSTSDSACLWLAKLGRFDVLEKLASTGVYKDWPTYQLFFAAPTLLGLSKVHTIAELREWLATAQQESVSGCAYLAFQLAKQNRQAEAERVLEVVPDEWRRSNESVRLSLAQGLALGVGIEHARMYIKDRRQTIERDYAGDIWTVAQALIAVDRVDDAIKLLLEDTYEHPGMEQTWVELAGALRKQHGADEVAATLTPISLKFAADIASRYAVVDEEYARAFLAALMNRISDPNWGEGLGTEWPGVAKQGMEIDAIQAQTGDRLDQTTLGRLIIGRDIMLDLVHEEVLSFDFSPDRIPHHVFLALPGKLWLGGRDYSSHWPLLSLEEVEAELEALNMLESQVFAGILSAESLFYTRLGCCYLAAYPYPNIVSPMIDVLKAQLEDQPELLWQGLIVIPAALSAEGRMCEAQQLVFHVTSRFQETPEEISEFGVSRIETIRKFCQIQIAMAAPLGAERNALLSDVLENTRDLNLLVEMYSYFVHRNDYAAETVLESISKIVAEARLAVTDSSGISSDDLDNDIPSSTHLTDIARFLHPVGGIPGLDEVVGSYRSSLDSAPSIGEVGDVDFFGEVVAELNMSGDDEAEDDDDSVMGLDSDVLVQVCYQLILASQHEMLRRLLIEVGLTETLVQEYTSISPFSLQGMLRAFSLDGTRKSFKADMWPHSVLLAEAENVVDADHFFDLVAATKTVVALDSITKAYQAITRRLSPQALAIVVNELTDEKRGIGDFERAILLAQLFPVAAHTDLPGVTPTELVARSLEHLRTYFASVEDYCWVYPWTDDSTPWWHRSSGPELTPRQAYCMGLAVLTRCTAEAGFTSEHERLHNHFMDTLYGLLRKTESWSQRRLRDILYELDDEQLMEQVVKLFREMGERWRVAEDIAA